LGDEGHLVYSNIGILANILQLVNIFCIMQNNLAQSYNSILMLSILSAALAWRI
jgi:hypothetical protein